MNRLFVLFQYVLPQHLLSRVVAIFARSTVCKNWFIGWFIKRYHVDLTEALIEDPRAFVDFNDFFTRELKPGARPFAESDNAVLCPADGAISQLGDIADGMLLQAKGRHFSLTDLIGGDATVAEKFQSGCFATVYLSPKDYHRVHMPLSGQLERTTYVPGRLFSVNKATTERVPNLFARNERLVCEFATDSGPMIVILVGAMIVAGIETVWAGQVCPARGSDIRVTDYRDHSPAIVLAKGAELGRFYLGSTAIVVFPHGLVTLDASLRADSPVRMGQSLGHT